MCRCCIECHKRDIYPRPTRYSSDSLQARACALSCLLLAAEVKAAAGIWTVGAAAVPSAAAAAAEAAVAAAAA